MHYVGQSSGNWTVLVWTATVYKIFGCIGSCGNVPPSVKWKIICFTIRVLFVWNANFSKSRGDRPDVINSSESVGSGEFANEKTYLADFKDFVFIEKPARRNDKKCQIQGHFYYKNFLKTLVL